MKPEKQQLIDDLLVPENRREAILSAGYRVLRRRRQWRIVRRSLVVLVFLAGIGLWFKEFTPAPPPPQASVPATKPATTQETLTDDQLLALFPDTPVALATLSDGTKRLIFPRPGDDQKFVTRF